MKNKILVPFVLLAMFVIAACSEYGEKVIHNNGEVYFKEPATETEANALGQYLVSSGYFDSIPKSVQLLKEGSTYTVNFVVKKGVSANQEITNDFKLLSPAISYDVFNGSLVNIGLTDDKFESEFFIVGYNFGERIFFGNDRLYYTKDISNEIANALGNFLQESGFFQGTGLQAQITKEGEAYQFKYIVKQGFENDAQYKATVSAFGLLISQAVFSGQRLDIHLCNDFMETIEVVPSI